MYMYNFVKTRKDNVHKQTLMYDVYIHFVVCLLVLLMCFTLCYSYKQNIFGERRIYPMRLIKHYLCQQKEHMQLITYRLRRGMQKRGRVLITYMLTVTVAFIHIFAPTELTSVQKQEHPHSELNSRTSKDAPEKVLRDKRHFKIPHSEDFAIKT